MGSGLLAGILYILALVLVNLYSRYYFLILIPALAIWIGGFVFATNWRWVCTVFKKSILQEISTVLNVVALWDLLKKKKRYSALMAIM